MQTSLQDADRTRRLAYSAAFLCAALMLSLAESILLPTGLFPIPGAKPGLANAAVLLCATLLGRKRAAAVSLARVTLMFILFGTGTSAIYSFSGAALSFIGIALFCNNPQLSFFGKIIIAAVMHNIAQALCAMLIFGLPAAVLIPWMIIAAVICGGFTGLLLNLIYPAITKVIRI